MAEERQETAASARAGGPLAHVSAGLHKVDALLHTTRQRFERRFREGATALSRRGAGETAARRDRDTKVAVNSEAVLSTSPRRLGPLRLLRDADYVDAACRDWSAEGRVWGTNVRGAHAGLGYEEVPPRQHMQCNRPLCLHERRSVLTDVA